MLTEINEGFRLSPQQAQVWDVGGDKALAFHAYCLVQFDGRLDRNRMSGALQQAVDRYEIFRTSFARVPGMEAPLQIIAASTPKILLEGIVSMDFSAMSLIS